MSTDHERKSPHKKTGKAGTDNIMNEAPLFAGLDGFVLQHGVKTEPENFQVKQPREKKKTVTRKPKVVKADKKPLQPTQKKQKPTKLDPDAVLLSVAEMCTLLKISRATLIRMDKAGKLPGKIKLGGSIRFHRETVEAWLQSLINK